jgi:hypothetical protein
VSSSSPPSSQPPDPRSHDDLFEDLQLPEAPPADERPSTLLGPKDPFDWSGGSLGVESGTDMPRVGGSDDLGGASVPAPPPLPPQAQPPPLPFSEDLSSDLVQSDPVGSLRFPPPPALTGDLSGEVPPEDVGPGYETLRNAPREAFEQDPFAELREAPPPPDLRSDAPAAPPALEPTRSSSIPLARGRVELTPPRRTEDVAVMASVDMPQPPPPVSTLRWPPWVGFVLGLAAAAFALPSFLAGDVLGPPQDVRTIEIGVHPYALERDPPLWVVQGTAETRARPFPDGVLVEVRIRGPGSEQPLSTAEAYLGLEPPVEVLAAGPEAARVFRQREGAPPMSAAQRARFTTVVRAPSVNPARLEFDVRYQPASPDGRDLVDERDSAR